MKLALKITGILFLVTTLLLIINTTYSVRREIKLFDEDMKRDAELLGDVLKSLIVNVWENSGELQAIQVMKNLNDKQPNMRIQWIWFNDIESAPFIQRSDKQILLSILSRHETTFLVVKQPDGPYLHTFVPVQIMNLKLGAVQLSESLAERDKYVRSTVVNAAILIIGLLVLNGLMLRFFGIKIIGRPLQLLVKKTERISEGDLSADVQLKGKDELAELASAFNQMCDNLSKARETARQETDKRIATMEQLRHSERLATVGRLASGMAHELGTPLNVVSGRAKLIASESLTEQETREFASIIHEQSERMTKIIRQLLDFSRRRAPQRSSVSIAMIFNQIKDMLNSIARKNAVNIVLGETSGLPPIHVDHGQIQQVLINLVMNAIQAMPNGGDVELSAQIDDTDAELSTDKKLLIFVKDHGEGILPEHVDHIFEPFFTTKDVGVGTGLGLSIVYGIIEEHGGHIDVKSMDGQGTTFIISLPLESTT